MRCHFRMSLSKLLIIMYSPILITLSLMQIVTELCQCCVKNYFTFKQYTFHVN